jgi:SAM-dependent methyltransferase
MLAPKERFSDRVADYVRYRPDYPSVLIETLARAAHLGPASTIADVGSGTGIFARRLLEIAGARVIAIEPNAPMRQAAEAASAHEPRFESRDAAAEATGLADASVDAVTAAQAFHWFEPKAARAEFARILRPGGHLALVWNQRRETPQNRDYEAMLERFAPEYKHVREKDRAAEPMIRAFFAPHVPVLWTFANEQSFDAAGLRGRLTSSSYAPRAEDPLYPAILAELRAIFDAHAKDGRFVIAYDTVLWLGQLG